MTSKTVLITGGTRGIGRSTACVFASHGFQVVVSGKSKTYVPFKEHDNIRVLQADVRKSDDVERLVEHTIEQCGSLDVVIGCAGIQISALAAKTTDEQWHDVIDTNLSGAFYLSRAAMRAMKDTGGSIVHVSSASGFMAHAGASAYVASKHGLIGLVQVLALEGAKYGIRINTVAPGLTDTDMVAHLNESQRDSLFKQVPMHRLGTPDEIAQLIYWVAVDATYSTGSSFHANGGIVMA